MSDNLSRPLDEFKERELEILALMAAGHTNTEIADRLFITKETVRWYNKQIYSKLGTSRRTEAVALARRLGIIGGGPAPSPSSGPVRHALPALAGPFVGRDGDLRQLADLLADPDVRLLSLIGAGGMGKSRLALELGHRKAAGYQHGAAFVDLAAIDGPDETARAATAALDVPVGGSQTAEQALLDYCRAKELLLIFDNWEHVLAGAPLLSRLLAAAPGVTIIATSRERLNLRAETAYPLQPMDPQQAAQLFLDVARVMHPTVALDEQDRPVVERLAALVGGLPLALVLAATWVDTLSVAEIAAEINTGLDVLAAEMGDIPDRQRSMQAVIDPTWQRLSDAERTAFMRAALFRGGFTRQAFQEVTGRTLRTLQTLLNRSLIAPARGRRFQMHPLLQQYALEKLAAGGDEAAARQAHLTSFLAYAQIHAARLKGAQYSDALHTLAAEQDNFRVALDWALDGNAPEEGIALVKALARFWADRSLMGETIHYLELAISRQPGFALHEAACFFLYRLGQPVDAEAQARAALAMAQETESPERLARGCRLLALVTQGRQRDAETQALLEQALAQAQASASAATIALCRESLTIFLSSMGAPSAELIPRYQEALNTWESLGNVMAISRTTYNLGLEYSRQGDGQRARELVERSLDLKRELRDRAGIARRLAALGTWSILDEEHDRARRYLAESRELATALGEPARLRYTLLIEGFLFMITGEYARAEATLAESLQLATALQAHIEMARCQALLAMLHLLQGDSEAAYPRVRQALAAHVGSDQPPWEVLGAYGSYLLTREELAPCLRIAVVVERERSATDSVETLGDRFLLRPLVYRVRQRMGESVWQEAVAASADVTPAQLFAEAATACGVGDG